MSYLDLVRNVPRVRKDADCKMGERGESCLYTRACARALRASSQPLIPRRRHPPHAPVMSRHQRTATYSLPPPPHTTRTRQVRMHARTHAHTTMADVCCIESNPERATRAAISCARHARGNASNPRGLANRVPRTHQPSGWQLMTTTLAQDVPGSACRQ